MSKKLFAASLLALGTFATSASAAFYNPFGPQRNVSLSVITAGGWTLCYSSQMHVAIGANDALRTGTYSKTLTFTLSTTTP